MQSFIDEKYKEVKILTTVDSVNTPHFFRVSEYEKDFFSSYEGALAVAIQASDEYDKKWSQIMGGKIRRPWEEQDKE